MKKDIFNNKLIKVGRYDENGEIIPSDKFDIRNLPNINDLTKYRWHKSESVDQSRSLKTHCFVRKDFPDPYTNLETVEGNISLCGQVIITEGEEPVNRVKLEDIEPQELVIKYTCKKCLKIFSETR